ncbi:penicillin acylase family protein [Veronia nyctiphanis]|uniref:penicillin acylase family protein n=1 Tax=Veronia nyctiphanis TaxID=1278244 RepID=UPI001F2B92B5|nr:penicillin acylase family protein [Veronia nyctiphanis]
MLNVLKKIGGTVILLALLATAIIYGLLYVSLPALSGTASTNHVKATTTLARDDKGIAIIHADNRLDAAYAMGYAHAQDRFFQMDLLRRNAAGELSELFGDGALTLDKSHRFHQFRTRSQTIFSLLPGSDKALLESYSSGVNDALLHSKVPSFEYLLTGSERKPWLPEDSILAIYSMYFDLQGRNVKRDLLYTQIAKEFGNDMLGFITQASEFQAALDGSRLPVTVVPPPKLDKELLANSRTIKMGESPAIGSNNWAVSGKLTNSGHAMLSNDMHLGINVPVIWYRAQINVGGATPFSVDGLTLPGTPAVVSGSNRHVAWGFTNSFVDNADWVHLSDDISTNTVVEIIKSEGKDVEYELELSKFGPVRIVDGEKYALSWVAHQPYAVNLGLLRLETASSVEEALAITKYVGIPAQNMVVVDSSGNLAWQLTGAVPNRKVPANVALSPSDYPDGWQEPADDTPFILNPENNRLWTANSRVVGKEADTRFGNGGYALGARSQQIRDRLLSQSMFDEQDFYQIQRDNEAKFLVRWHTLLLGLLNTNANLYAEDIEALKKWKQCACSDSVGYTLVRHFRSALIDQAFAPLETALSKHGMTLKTTRRTLEPAIWQLVKQQPDSWKPKGSASWTAFMLVYTAK